MNTYKPSAKLRKKIKAIREGGRLLAQIKKELISFTTPTTSLEEIDHQADILIKASGGEASFKTVPGYNNATCINLNEGLVHGIPKGSLKTGDLVSLDVGLLYQGFHTDTSTSFVVGQSKNQEVSKFLSVGRNTLTQAIAQAKPGNRVWDISQTIQKGIESSGYSVALNLTGHGVGKSLHEEPSIPCFVYEPRERTPILKPGQTLAIEIMYAMGSASTRTLDDGWTMVTKDGSLAAMFEETVIVTNGKPEIVTAVS